MLNKEQILEEAKTHLDRVGEAAKAEQVRVQQNIIRLSQRVSTIGAAEDKAEVLILANNRERNKQLKALIGSPYFLRCDAEFEGVDKELYFGKFQLVEENIYSWVSPIAQLRFANLGPASYQLPKGEERAGVIKRKDQFMIVDGRIMFMASESEGYERTLIHQEHLAGKKSDFVLPEIVAQMEKAQDEVIRAPHLGSFLIAGPAGSGKTTLAFHRIAYLTQSPDTAKIFPGYNIVVFVQDESTKKYFSAILPQLGIEEVTVTTFEAWALDVLGLHEYKSVQRFGDTEQERDELEYYKNIALIAGKRSANAEPEKILKAVYKNLPPKFTALLAEQLSLKQLDRFDLTVLLRSHIEDSSLFISRRVVVEDKKGNMKMTQKKVALKYSFVVVDEAENYLSEQIRIIKACTNENKAVLYVGDLAQQTKLGTIKDWEEAQEDFTAGSKVVLDKVYRNTQEILEYARRQGYQVSIPAGLKQGTAVIEKTIGQAELFAELKAIETANPDVLVGILFDAENEHIFAGKKALFSDNVKFLTFNEAQGVEFEAVVLCRFASVPMGDADYPADLRAEKEKIRRDLWYVALTRSMDKLLILDII
jgi:DNA helicase IV